MVFLPLDRRLARWLSRRVDLGGRRQLLVGGVQDLLGRRRALQGRQEELALPERPEVVRLAETWKKAVDQLGYSPNAAAKSLRTLTTRKLLVTVPDIANPFFSLIIQGIEEAAYAMSPSIARGRVSREERERAERVLAHVGDGVFLVDHDGVIRLWNPAAEAITGLRSDAICDRFAEETISGWAAIAGRVPVAHRPGDADDASSAETVPLEIEGREIWLSILGATLGDGIVYAFRDVTRERRLEELRAQFVATISHELRTPLASLHGAAMTLLEREQDLHEQTRHDLLDMIAVQSKRLAGLVIDVSIPAVLPKVAGDAERTRQVLTNLIDNAIKYSPQGGRIELGVEADADSVRFTVRDEGLGIPLGEQKRIFEKFYRLDPDHRRGIGGSGLGLYICRELVRSMHGRIWVESDPGQGARFTFELPVAERVTAPA